MLFTYEAMTSDGQVLADRVDGGTSSEVAESLRAKGLTVLRLQPLRDSESAGAGTLPGRSLLKRSARPANSTDLVLITQQLKMLLQAGSALVPALEAIEQQSAKQSVAKLIREIREHVERGGTLTDAFSERPDLFKPLFCSMVSAGEATASLPETFDRLNELTVRHQKVRKTLLGALLYPAILSFLCVAVAVVVLGFVVPRFIKLLESLNTPLPTVTRIMFTLSEYARSYWPAALSGLVVLIMALVIVLRMRATRAWFDRLFLYAPLIGGVYRRLVFARILRIWAAMLRSHVSLLETIQHSKTALSNTIFIKLVSDVEEAVVGGGSIGSTLAESELVDPVIASAIRTGEENGRLAESIEFVSTWLDENNTQLVTGLTRIAEPALLTVMGLFVGFVAMSLFIPMFDLAMAGSG